MDRKIGTPSFFKIVTSNQTENARNHFWQTSALGIHVNLHYMGDTKSFGVTV